jgi:outer membrane lipoprotein SlyB
MGPRASALIVNAFRSGSNIYGAAAMKSAAKLLRSNAITAGVSLVILSSVDVVNIFRGRISGAQLFKNITNTAASVGGGTAGWVGGAAVGATIGSAVPIIGTAIGGIVGGLAGALAGGTLAGKASDAVLGVFIEDDANQMIHIIEETFRQLAEDYLLSRTEAEQVIDALKADLTGGTLKDMFASDDRQAFAHNLLVPHVEAEVQQRQPVRLPSDTQLIQGLRSVLEELSSPATTPCAPAAP